MSGLRPKGAPLRGLRSSPSGFEERSLRELNELPSALSFCLKRPVFAFGYAAAGSGLQAKRSSNEVLHKRSGHFARSALSLLPSVMKISANPHKAKNIADATEDFTDSRTAVQ